MAIIYGTGEPDVINGSAANDTIYGWNSDGDANSPSGNDTLNGNAGNDDLNGGTDDDTLDGGLGSDSLTGGIGNDDYIVDSVTDVITEYMNLGSYIGVYGEEITIDLDYDTVRSSVSYTLGEGESLEELTLTGSNAISGTGNDLDNSIYGNAANNSLSGKAGDDYLDGGLGSDTLIGATGNDVYFVDSTGDTIIEYFNQGIDYVGSSVSYTLGYDLEDLTLTGLSDISGTGNTLNNNIIGNNANNFLYGGEGDDNLDGGLGSDTLIGATGNDSYIVESTGDTVTEYFNQGVDKVESSINYTLGRNLENLILTGSANSGTGNSLNNSIFGSFSNNSLYGAGGNDFLAGYSLFAGDGDQDSSDDYLDGGAGSDTLEGGFGSDSLYGGAGNDSLYAYARPGGINGDDNNSLYGGTGDDILSGDVSKDYLAGDDGNDNLDGGYDSDTLIGGNGNDNLDGGDGYGSDTLIGGNGNDNLDGGDDSDTLTAGNGNDNLDGGYGSDTLTGGTGADNFGFSYQNEGIDTIKDFSVAEDTISVSASGFYAGLTPGAAITTDQFVLGRVAVDANDKFIYNQNTGALFFDSDGTGTTGQVQFATLSTGLAMTNADISVV